MHRHASAATPAATLSLPARALIVLVLSVRAAMIGVLLVLAGGNPQNAGLHLFTYVAQCLHLVSLSLCVAGFTRPRVLQFAMLVSLPMMVLLSAFVSVAIVLAVSNSERIYTHHLDCYGGTRAFGYLHTRDFIMHPLVAFEMLLIWCAVRRVARKHVAAALCAMSPSMLRLYRLYVVTAALLPFMLYCSILDIHRVYELSASTPAMWAGLTPVGLALGALYWYAMLPRARCVAETRNVVACGAHGACGACGAVVPVLRLDQETCSGSVVLEI